MGRGGTAGEGAGGEETRWRITCHLRGGEGEDRRLLSMPEVSFGYGPDRLGQTRTYSESFGLTAPGPRDVVV